MSDLVIVALISGGASIIVALITQAPAILNRKTTDDSPSKMKKEIGALKRKNKEKQEIIDYYRKRDGK